MSTVSELLSNPFSSRTLSDQVLIVECGPTSDFDVCFRDDENGMLHFKKIVSISCDSEWITVCPLRQSLFCWPCVLFSDCVGDWSKHGFSDWASLSEKVREHEKSVEHIDAVFRLKMFCLKNIKPMDLDFLTNASEQSKTRKEHREGLRVLVDAIINLHTFQESASFMNPSYNGLVSVDGVIAFLESLRNYSCSRRGIEGALQLVGKSPSVINDLVDATTRVLKSAIKSDLRTVSNVCVILSEHSKTVGSSFLSTVLRYVKDREVCESFIGFTTMKNERKAVDIYDHIINVLKEFSVTDRFLSYSLDGGVLPLKELSAFRVRMKTEHPSVFFLPWHSHSLESDLLQGLACIKECNEFCHSMNNIKYFFHKNSKRLSCFVESMTQEGFAVFIQKHIVIATYTFRNEMIKYFNSIVKNPYSWNPDDVSCAFGARLHLQQFQTVFFLNLFYRIFGSFSQFVTLMQGSKPEDLLKDTPLRYLRNYLQLLRVAGFDRFWSCVRSECGGKSKLPADLNEGEYRTLFNNVLHNVLEHLQCRFGDLKKLEFTHLLLPEQPNQNVRNKFFSEVQQMCRYISVEDLRTELDILQENASLLSVNIDGDSDVVWSLHQFLVKSGCRKVMLNVFKLADMCVALPVRKTLGTEPKFKLVKEWSQYKDSVIQHGDKAVLAVEMGLLKQLEERGTFYNDVISAFTSASDSVRWV